METLEKTILNAWEAHKSRIESDPAEFARRIARRHSPTFLRCPRAWCLAVRASDRRINPMHAIIVPEDAMDDLPKHAAAHDVTLDARVLKRLCTPVHTDFPYSSRFYLARKLGVAPNTLSTAVRKADPELLRSRIIQGKLTRDERVFYAPGALDPGYAWHFQPAHFAWGNDNRWLCDYVPEDFEQVIRRIPVVRSTWRKIPGRESIDGAPQFSGFRWVCPACEKRVRTLYYPMPGFNTLRLSDLDVEDGHPDGLPAPPRSFACHACHRVRYFETTTHNAWNYVVNHISGGLLFGREVPKPDFWKPERKRKYHPQLTRKADRRAEVQKLLLQGQSRDQIARQMQITKNAVGNHVTKIYAQHRVHSHKQLATRLQGIAPTPSKPRRQQVEQLLLQGLRYEDIAKHLGVGRSAICFHATNIYRDHNVKNRRQLREKLKALHV